MFYGSLDPLKMLTPSRIPYLIPPEDILVVRSFQNFIKYRREPRENLIHTFVKALNHMDFLDFPQGVLHTRNYCINSFEAKYQ